MDDLRGLRSPVPSGGWQPRSSSMPRWSVKTATDWIWAQTHVATWHHLTQERGGSQTCTKNTMLVDDPPAHPEFGDEPVVKRMPL